MDAFRGTLQQQFQRFSAEGGRPLPLIVFAGAAVVALVAGFISPAAGFALLVLGLLAALIAEFVQSERAGGARVPSAPQASGTHAPQAPSTRAEVEIEDLAGPERDQETQARRIGP